MVWGSPRKHLTTRHKKAIVRGGVAVLVLTVMFIFVIKRIVLGQEASLQRTTAPLVVPKQPVVLGLPDHATSVVVGGGDLRSIIQGDHRKAQQQSNEHSKNEEIESMSDVPMPYKYPMHKNLPSPRHKLVRGMHDEHLSLKRQSDQCWGRDSASQIVFQSPPTALKRIVDPEVSAKLKKEFDYEDSSSETFFEDSSGASDDLLRDEGRTGGGNHPWWVEQRSVDDIEADLPCTAEVQARLYELQHPPRKTCDKLRFLVSKLKEGAHGVGSALTLVAHDFLSSIMVGRVLQLQTSSKWYFASSHCSDAKRGGWDCFFLPVSTCRAPSGGVETVNNRRQALRSISPVIVKKSFDIDGLSRNDLPSDELFFGDIQSSSCYPKYKEWIRRPANVYVQGTFDRGADARLFYMLAQATRYLMRAPQPWFRQMLMHHLPKVGISSSVIPQLKKNDHAERVASDGTSETAVIYVQERGEIAKFREYYNVFGCHNINNTIFLDYVTRWCGSTTTSNLRCKVYISGNTPFRNYQQLTAAFEGIHLVNGNTIEVLSTWRHPSVAAAETERWGASAPASSWIDMFAGAASTNWVCIVQSNWCRVINLLRLTSGRARCGFIDGGALMIASSVDREKYCLVGPYPTKAFSNRLK